MSEEQTPHNSRKMLYEGKVPVELWATQVIINYDPINRSARVLFNGTGMTQSNGVVFPMTFITDQLEVDMGTMKKQCFGRGKDPNTQADLSNISIEGLDRLISQVYDHFHNERDRQRREAEAQAQAYMEETERQRREALNAEMGQPVDSEEHEQGDPPAEEEQENTAEG